MIIFRDLSNIATCIKLKHLSLYLIAKIIHKRFKGIFELAL